MRPYSLATDRLAKQLERRGITDTAVLDAIRAVPRHLFVREHLQSQAYADLALPIGQGQTISQPYIVAKMTELLEVEKQHAVLEVGTGTGYHTAVLARLARWVHSLERVSELARQAIGRMREIGVDNVKIQAFDGTFGWSEVAPFDRIIVSAGAPQAPQALLDQLKLGGRMVIPEGDRDNQRLVVYVKTERRMRRKVGEPVTFVPLIGRHGWDEP